MGRWVVLFILLGGLSAGAIFYWLRLHTGDFQNIAEVGLLQDFRAQQAQISAALPATDRLNGTEAWGLNLQGDELWIQAPSLEKASGTAVSKADFDEARLALLKNFETWLAHRPGNTQKFPLVLHFRNEDPAPHSMATPNATN